MRKLYLVMLVVGLTVSGLWSQDESPKLPEEATSKLTQEVVPTSDSLWLKELVGNLNFSNTAYDNWTAGGEDALTWNLKINGKIERDALETNWKTSGKIEYGQTKIGDGDLTKSLDKFFLETIYRYKLTDMLNPYAAATAESQFFDGYDYSTDPATPVSTFWDPGYLTQSVGMGFLPFKNFITRLGFSVKETFSREYKYVDDTTTVNTLETAIAEPGLESVTDYSAKLNKIVQYQTKLNVFVNFQGVEEIDGKWENLLTAQISKYINVNFGFDMLYDYDLSDTRQIMQNLSVGVNYSFL